MKNIKLKKGLIIALMMGTLVGCGTTDKEKVKDDEIVDKDIDGKKEEEDNLKPDVLNTTDMTVEELIEIQQEACELSDGCDNQEEQVIYTTIDESVNIPASVQKEAGFYIKYRYNMWELDEAGNIIEDTESAHHTSDNTSLYDIYRGKGVELFGFNVLTTEDDIKAGRHILEYDGKKYQLEFNGYIIFKVKDYKIVDDKIVAEIYVYNLAEKKAEVYDEIIQDQSFKDELTDKTK